ncbi:antirepressor [Sphingomonas sp. DBB INV C78]|uniref:ArdC family protein n=1 Tax=Sphingomonas sp. DBB INV C78 TaxID=3349434 RepID=UPI0036D3A229
MAKSANPRARREPREARENLYDNVTRRIIAQLEDGRIPWVQSWGNAAASVSLPRNALSGRAYSGINILLLWGAVIERGYSGQGWLTFRQALMAGGHVRKGEEGVTVVYADRFTPEAERERASRDGDDARGIAFLKRFTVFNVAQCEDLPEGLSEDAPPLPDREIVPVAEALIAATGADFRIGGDKAFYAPGPDFVSVPPQPAFTDQINYYRTALHELGHWTGHGTRLARDLSNPFGSDGYAREELIAELCSAFLCASLGITPTVRHADYVGAWLDVLKGDARAIFRAASAASKAADHLLALGGPAVAALLGERP